MTDEDRTPAKPADATTDGGGSRDPADPGTADPADAEAVDPAELREDLDAIKSAMGIEERYPGQARMWLVYGTVIGLTAVLTNVSFVFDLPDWAYVAAWHAMIAIVVLAQWRLVSETSAPAAPGVDWRQLFGAMVLGYFALTTAVGEVIASNTADEVRGILFFSLVVFLLGLTFLVVGIVLGAEGIARRDRLPFYVGGGWMLVLAGFMPHVRFLQLTGWAVFGVAFFLHAVGAYLLTRPD